MKPIYYLVSYYGGYLSLDTQINQFVISNDEHTSHIPIVYHDKRLYLLKNNELIDFTVENSQFTFEDYSIYLRLKMNNMPIFINDKREIVFLTPYSLITPAVNFMLVTKNSEQHNLFYKDKLTENPLPYEKDIPQIIWAYWEQNERPDIVDRCYNRLININPTRTIHLLNRQTIYDFLPSDFLDPIFKSNITPVLRSDIIRLELLYQYGGIWVDSSIIFNEPIEKIIPHNFKSYYETIMFYIEKHLPRLCPHAEVPIFENWFIATCKENQFIKIWRDYLLPVVKLGLEGLYESFKQHPDYAKVTRVFDERYHIAYLAEQYAQLELKKLGSPASILAYSAENSAFYYQNKNLYYNYWGHISNFNELFTLSKETLFYLPKLIKLVSVDRDNLRKIKELELCTPNSYLYPFLYD